MFKKNTAFAALLLLFGACSSPGALQLTSGGLVSRSSSLDFGQLAPGSTRTITVTLQNTGPGTLRLVGFDKVSGDAAQALPGVDEAGAVFLSGLGALELAPGAQLDVTVTFAPPRSAVIPTTYGAVLTVRATNAVDGKDAVTLALAGRATEDPCALPDALDFGGVARGDTAVLSLTITNPLSTDGTALVDEPLSAQAPTVFTLTPDSPPGAFPLGPGAERVQSVVFAPTEEARDYFGSLGVRVPGCALTRVALVGAGVDQTITLDAEHGGLRLHPAGRARRARGALRELELPRGAPDGHRGLRGSSAEHAVRRGSDGPLGAGRHARRGDARAGARRATSRLSFSPSVLGPRPASLRATTDLSRQPSIEWCRFAASAAGRWRR